MYNMVDMDIIWMYYAVILSKIAGSLGNVSVGAVLIYQGNLIGYGYNSSVICNDPSAHAEIIALRMGGRYLGNYRLLNTILYVTLEPCIMCIGAMIQARIFKLVCGAKNNKGRRWINLWNKYTLNILNVNHCFDIKTGVLNQLCCDQIINFFKCRRN